MPSVHDTSPRKTSKLEGDFFKWISNMMLCENIMIPCIIYLMYLGVKNQGPKMSHEHSFMMVENSFGSTSSWGGWVSGLFWSWILACSSQKSLLNVPHIYYIYIVYVYYMYNIVYPQDSKVYLNYSRLPASGSWPVVWYSCCMSYNWAIYNLHTAVCTTAGRQRRNLQEWFIKPKIHVTWQNCSDWGLSSIEMSQVSTLFGGFSHLLFWHKGLWHILRGIRSHSALDGFFGIIMIFWNIPSLIAWQQTLWNSN